MSKKNRITLVFAILLFSFTVFLHGESSANSAMKIWDEATKIVELSNDCYPQIITDIETTYNQKGKLEEEIITKISANRKDSIIEYHIESVEIDGEYLSDKKLAKLNSSKNEFDDSIDLEIPFLADNPNQLTIAKEISEITFEQKECNVIKYTQIKKNEIWKGKAYIEKESNIPIALEFFLSNTPYKEDSVVIYSSTYLSRYSYINKKLFLSNTKSETDLKIKIAPLITFRGKVINEKNMKTINHLLRRNDAKNNFNYNNRNSEFCLTFLNNTR